MNWRPALLAILDPSQLTVVLPTRDLRLHANVGVFMEID